jgi:amino acid transporter
MSDRAGGRGPGLREVLAIAVVALLVVLAIEAVSNLVPAVRDAFRGLPLTVVALVAGTATILVLVLRSRPAGPGD